ncbi:MAG: transposase, partial [Aeromonadales bacterium]|nr:transposase [Aeromonadales bacterium]
MTRPRSELVSTEVTPYYHCISRCVRRAYLYGIDSHTGQDFRHRKQWIQERLLQLQAVFTVNLCAYAIMDNHYHLVIHIDTKTAHQLSEQEVALRWH